MILGIGTDLVDIARMRAALDRHGERFARRILSPAEWPDWQASGDPARLLAKRFAAKEAFAKASGQGLRAPVTLGALAVTHDALGRPSKPSQAPERTSSANAAMRARTASTCAITGWPST